MSANPTPLPPSAATTAASLLRRPALRWLLLAMVAVWLATLGGRKLLDPDEGRYAEIPREMVAGGDWLTPRLNDLKYFEKPALQYWTTAIAFELLGNTEFAARLWVGLTGLAGIFFTGWLARRLFGRDTGFAAAILLGCSLMYVVLGHLSTLDMGLSFFMLVTLGGFLLAQDAAAGSAGERNFMLLAWGAAALALLSKGIVALVLPAFALVVYTLVEREYSAWKRLHIGKGMLLFLAIGAPWFVAVSIKNPEFAHFFFLHEHFERFLTDVHRRVEPWWFFIPILFAGMLPWAALALHSLRSEWQMDRVADAKAFRARRFLFYWTACIFVFFSLSHSKLAPYILPVIPALAIITGEFVTRTSSGTLRKHVLGIGVFWLLVGAYLALGPIAHKHGIPQDVMDVVFRRAALGPAVAFLGTLGAYWLLTRSRRYPALLSLCVGTFLAFTALIMEFDIARHIRSGYELAQAIRPYSSRSNVPVYSVWDYDHSLAFYLERPLTLVDYKGELAFGQEQEPGKSLPNIAAFAAAWRSDPPGSIAVIRDTAYQEVQATGIPMIEIGRRKDRIVIKKPAEKPDENP